MSGIVGVYYRGGRAHKSRMSVGRKLVKKMLEKIRHRGIGGQKIIETEKGAMGVVYRKSRKAPFINRSGLSMVWDGRFSGDLQTVQAQSPLALAAMDRE